MSKPSALPYSDVPIVEINTIGENKGTLKVRNLQGLESVIDFSGNEVTFSGNLPVDIAARKFFEAVGDYFRADKANWIA